MQISLLLDANLSWRSVAVLKKWVLFLGIISFIFVMLHQTVAAPAVPWLVEKQQPDGSKIFVYIKGDEKVHWMESADGYTLMYDSEKNIVYAEQDPEGNMSPSQVKYTQSPIQSSVSFRKRLCYSPSQITMLKQIWKINSPNLRASQQQSSVIGSKKALCVLMDFPDKTFTKQAEFNDLMNQAGYSEGTAKGSVKDFYRENSYDQMDLTVTVVGPYRANDNLLYYTESNFPNAEGYQILAQEAIEKANADGVDLSQFANENNELETFHIIYAGYGDEAIGNGQQIWAHKWQLAAPIILSGVHVSVYSCSPELRNSSGNTITSIGVICHELSHVFGSPDYYDVDYSGYGGSGRWDLMANGSWNGNGDTPAHINIFQKTLYGWVEPVELTSCTEVENMPNSAENPVAYSIKANTTGEMYLLENRQQVRFDVGVPGHGLLIWHIHKDALSGNGSNDTHPQQVYPVVASSSVVIPDTEPSSYGSINSAGTPFPGTSGKTYFTDNSIPQAFTWDGLTGIGKPVTNISEVNNEISFIFMEGAPEPVANFQATVVDDDKVVLSWTPTVSVTATGYKIYRNDIFQYAISGRTSDTYTQFNVPNGMYEYSITSVEGFLESVKAYDTAVVTESTDTSCSPVCDLGAYSSVDEVLRLEWDAPSIGWKSICVINGAVEYIPFPYTAIFGRKWSTSELRGMNGFSISKVKFIPYEEPNYQANYTVMVYSITGNGTPELVYEQPIAQTLSSSPPLQYNEIQLDTPVEIDASKGWIVGIRYEPTGSSGAALIVVDKEQNSDPRNVFYVAPYGWFTLSEGIEVENNYCLEVYFDGEEASEFIIYRDGQFLTTVTNDHTNEYIDDLVNTNTTYSYCVSAGYSDCVSEPVCTEITTIDNPVGMKTPHEDVLVYCKDQIIYAVSTASNPIRRIEIYNLQGKRIYFNDRVNAVTYAIHNNISLPEICIVRLITETKTVNKIMIIK